MRDLTPSNGPGSDGGGGGEKERGGEGRRKRKKGVRIRIRVRRLERLVGLLQVDVYKKQVIVVRMFDVSYQGS